MPARRLQLPKWYIPDCKKVSLKLFFFVLKYFVVFFFLLLIQFFMGFVLSKHVLHSGNCWLYSKEETKELMQRINLN